MTDFTQPHPIIEQLIEQHITFIEAQLVDTDALKQEISFFCQWLSHKSLKDIITFEQLHLTFKHLLTQKEIPHTTLICISTYLRQAFINPINQNTTIADIINPLHVDDLAQYTASKQDQRQHLISHLTKHPAFVNIATQLIQHVLNDYLQNHLGEKNNPVSRFMKIGKSVLENVADVNLAQAIQQYLEKNVSKLALLAEKTLNQQLSNDNVYQLHVQLWHEFKNTPLSHAQHYIDANDLSHTIPLLHQFWDHLRHSDFFAQQLEHILTLWYLDHQNKPMFSLLQAIDISPEQINNQLHQEAARVLQQFITDGILKKRLTLQLQTFYYRASTLDLLKRI